MITRVQELLEMAEWCRLLRRYDERAVNQRRMAAVQRLRKNRLSLGVKGMRYLWIVDVLLFLVPGMSAWTLTYSLVFIIVIHSKMSIVGSQSVEHKMILIEHKQRIVEYLPKYDDEI